MKSAEEWFMLHNSCEAPAKGSYVYNLMIEHIKAIQLDAMKEGARRAADEVKKNMEYDQHLGNESWQQISKENMENILTTAEQWTEKDLT